MTGGVWLRLFVAVLSLLLAAVYLAAGNWLGFVWVAIGVVWVHTARLHYQTNKLRAETDRLLEELRQRYGGSR